MNRLAIIASSLLIYSFASATNAKTSGFKIQEVKAGSIYQKLGLRTGDVILSANGTPLTSAEDAKELATLISSESQLKLEIERDGKRIIKDYKLSPAGK